MVEDVFATASAHNMTVLRTWAFLDIGYQNGSGSVDGNGIKDGVYFQYFDPVQQAPVVNEFNLVHLDLVVATAKRFNMRLILTLTNNWSDFGGMDQYVQWRKWQNSSFTAFHDDFYVDPVINRWYQSWVASVVTRRNSLTGVAYRDDPTILAWELGNEPRCQGSGMFSSSSQCVLNYAVYGVDPVAARVGQWVRTMSAFVKSLDSNHLVATGDEGFACERYQTCPDVTCDCYYGVDSANFSAVPTIDFMSLHLYPGSWGKDVDWATQYILNHTALAQQIGKPVVLGEFGFQSDQHDVYATWTSAVESSGMNGDLFWMLAGIEDDGGGDNGYYPDYDGFAVYCWNGTGTQPPWRDPQSCDVLTAHASRMAS